VVLALPFTLLREVRSTSPLPPVKRRAIAELGLRHERQADDRLRPTRLARGARSERDVVTDLPFQLTLGDEPAPGRGEPASSPTSPAAQRRALGEGTPAEQARTSSARSSASSPASRRRAPGCRGPVPLADASLDAGQLRLFLPGQWTGINGASGQAVGPAALRRRALLARRAGLHGGRLRDGRGGGGRRALAVQCLAASG
jgi:monoamine oxidase